MVEKRVDERWKEEVERERRRPPPEDAAPRPSGQRLPAQEPPPAAPPAPATPPPPRASPPPSPDVLEETELPEPTFAVFLSGLSMQAMMALGELPLPGTTQRHVDLDQARYLIDTLGLLQEKTQGNLTAEESQFLDNALYELRLRYAQQLEASIPPPPGARQP